MDLYKHASYTNDKYSNGKYDTVIKLKNSRKKLERMIADYNLRYQAYVAYMKSRNGDWNDFKGQNDMSGLGLSPGDDDESAGWHYLGDTETVDECKRQALRDDTLYTRVVHYTPDQGYQGTWQYGCYASVPGAKTSSNSRFNAIGVTTSDRTYWVDEPVAAADAMTSLPAFNTMTEPASSRDWIYLGKYTPITTDSASLQYENGLYACKEMAKNPASTTIPGMETPAATYAANAPFTTILYVDTPDAGKFSYTCYGREGQPTQSNTVFLYKVNTTVSEFSPNQSSGTLAYNNAHQTRATKIYLSAKDLQLKNVVNILREGMKGITLTIQDPENTSRYQKWSVTSMQPVWSGAALELTVTSNNSASYKFWSAPNDKNAVVILADTVPGVTVSYQTRCMDTVSGGAGDDGGGNSGPPILKSQIVKDLQERYAAITSLHQQITGLFTPIPGLSNTLRSEMDKAVAELKTLEPEALAKRNAVTDLETNGATMDETDSHVRLNANRYVFVFYTIYAILFICGLVYLFIVDDDSAPAVKYVQTSLGVSVIILVAYHINQYYSRKS